MTSIQSTDSTLDSTGGIESLSRTRVVSKEDGRLHIVMGMGVYDVKNKSYMDNWRLGQALMVFLSIARTTPNSVVHFIYTGVDNDYLSSASVVAASCGDMLFDPIFVSEQDAKELLGNAVHSGLGTHAALRLVFSRMFTGLDECIWLDCDVIVLDDLNKLAEEARVALSGTRMYFAGSEYRNRVLINSGVLYEDLSKIRSIDGEQDRLIDMCRAVTDSSGSGLTRRFMDQDIINIVGVARVSKRWNVLLHEYERDLDTISKTDIGCIHLTGKYNHMISPLSKMKGFEFLEDLGTAVLSACPNIDERFLQIGKKDISGSFLRDHVYGRGPTLSHRDMNKVGNHSVDVVDIAFGISGDIYAEKVIQPAMVSYSFNSSVPIRFHVAYTPDTVSKNAIDSIVKLGRVLSREFKSEVDVVEVPSDILDCMQMVGNRSGSLWVDNLMTVFLHDIFPNVDICIKSDVDVSCVGDISLLVKWCLDRGLGESYHSFAAKSMWCNSFRHQYNFGVSPMSFNMIRSCDLSKFVNCNMLFGSKLRVDEILSDANDAGVVSVGEMPIEWNMIDIIRSHLVDHNSDISFIQRFDIFYSKKFRVDHVPVLDGDNYRKSTLVYHFTGKKPWISDDTLDGNVWRMYYDMAEKLLS